MNNLILTKVRYWRTEENGNQKKITEQYLVEAPTFGKAEERAVENSHHTPTTGWKYCNSKWPRIAKF